MKKILGLLLLLPAGAFANSCVSVSTGGAWNSPAVWTSCGGGVPGNGDTANIIDGSTITVTDNEIVGKSLQAGTTVMYMNNSGVLIIQSPGFLKVRGDVAYNSNGGSNTLPYLINYSTFMWDASLASPSTATYSAYGIGNYEMRPFISSGTSTTHAVVTSNASGGPGSFGLGSSLVGGVYTATYTDFSNIGSSVTAAFTYYTAVPWNFTHNTFTNCGLAPYAQANFLGAASIFINNYNTYTNSQDLTVGAVMYLGGDASLTMHMDMSQGGIRQMEYNSFDIQAGELDDYFDFTISGNYFGNGTTPGNYGNHPWANFSDNFIRGNNAIVGGYFFQFDGNVLNSYIYWDAPTVQDPHGPGFGGGLLPGPPGDETITGMIWERTGTTIVEGGKAVLFNGASLGSTSTLTVQNGIILPTPLGDQSFNLSYLAYYGTSAPSQTLVFNHNTVPMHQTPYGSPGIVTAHSLTPVAPPGSLEMWNNIFWCDTTTVALQSYKLSAIQTVETDVCYAWQCDYNDGYNTLTGTAGGFPTGGNGYSDNFTVVPGAHDISANPNFVDTTRNVATFDTAYLGHSATAWNSGGSYVIGNLVSSSSSTVYAGVTINYRYINATGCSSANPQPGIYTTQARACWEWASLYDLRTAISTGAVFTDPSIQVTNADMLTTIMQWVRAGYAPTNVSLRGAASDGSDIGAVPGVYVSSVTIMPGTAMSGGTTMSGHASFQGQGTIITGNSLQNNYLNIGNMATSFMGWTSYYGGDALGDQLNVTTTTVHGGEQYSTVIQCNPAFRNCALRGYQGETMYVNSNYFPTTAGNSYTASVWTQCIADTPNEASFFFFDDVGGFNAVAINCNGAWQQSTVNFTTTVGSTQGYLYLVYARNDSFFISGASVTNADGTAPTYVTKHRGIRNVYVSSDTVVVDGAPFFALGYDDVPYTQLSSAAANGANIIAGFGNSASADVMNYSTTSYLDKTYELGMNFMPSSAYASRTRNASSFTNIGNRFGPHLANIAWQMTDEFDAFFTIPNAYVSTTTLFNQYSALRPTLHIPIVNDSQYIYAGVAASSAAYYDPSTDIRMAEPYGNYAPGPSQFQAVDLTVANYNTLGVPKPLWLYDSNVSTGAIIPKAWYEIINGVTGIIYWNWPDYYSSAFQGAQSSFTITGQAIQEIKPLIPAIMGLNLNTNITATPTNVVAAMRQSNGHNYVFSVNQGNSVSGNISVTGLSPGVTITVLNESRTVTSGAGTIPDTWATTSRHLYQW